MDEGDEFYEYYEVDSIEEAIEKESMIKLQFEELYDDIKSCKCILFVKHPLSGLPALRLMVNDNSFGFEI